MQACLDKWFPLLIIHPEHTLIESMSLSSRSFQLFQFTAAHRCSLVMILTALKALLVSHYKAELSDFKPFLKLFFQFACQMDINLDLGISSLTWCLTLVFCYYEI